MAVIANLDILLGARVEGANRKLNTSTKAVDRLAKGVLAGAAAWKAYQAAQDSVANAANFERAFKKSTAIVRDLTEEQSRALRASSIAIDLDPNLAQTATEAAQGFEFLFLAGQSVEQSLGSIGQVAKFATAGSFDMATATDLATDSQSALGLSVKDTEQNLINLTRVTDNLVKASTIANASTQQFAQVLTNKAGTALRNYNKTVEEGLAVAAVYADQGLKAEEAGTAIAIVFRDLQRAAIENEAAFKRNNIQVFDAEQKFRNTADVIADFEKSLSGLTDQARTQKLLELGVPFKSLSFLLSLIGNSGQIRNYQRELESAAGTTEADSRDIMPEFDKATKRVAATFRAFNATAVVSSLELLGSGLNTLIDFLNTSTGQVTLWVAATFAAIPVISLAVGAIGKMVAIYRALAAVQIFTLVASNPVAGIAAIGAAAIATAGALAFLNNEFKKIDAGQRRLRDSSFANKIASNPLDDFSRAGSRADIFGGQEQLAVMDKFLERRKQIIATIDDEAKRREKLNKLREQEVAELGRLNARVDQGVQKKLEDAAAAQGLVESLRTPFEVFRNELEKINKFFKAGLLTPENRRRATNRAIEKALSKESKVSEEFVLNVGSAQSGSQDEFRSLFQQTLKVETENELEKKILAEAERQNELTTNTNDLLDDFLNRAGVGESTPTVRLIN